MDKEKFYNRYNIKLVNVDTADQLNAIEKAFSLIPLSLWNKANIHEFVLEDLGPVQILYPNKGRYSPNKIILNKNLIGFNNDIGNLTFFEFILIHELAHGLDEVYGKYKELSYQEEWLDLTHFTKDEKPGYKKSILAARGYPTLYSSWYHDPDVKYVRPYSKFSPLEFWADACAVFLAGDVTQLEPEIQQYFDRIFYPNERKIATSLFMSIKKEGH